MRKIEIFAAGCPVCRAGSLGIHQVPSVVVDGKLVQGIDEQSLRAAGIGQPVYTRNEQRATKRDARETRQDHQ